MTSQVMYGAKWSCDSTSVCHSHISMDDVFKKSMTIGEIQKIYTKVQMDIEEIKERIKNPFQDFNAPVELLREELKQDETFAIVLMEILVKAGREFKVCTKLL